MKKIFLILMAGAGLAVIFSCNRENDLGDENVTTKGTNVTDSTENSGITLHTEWESDSTVNF